AAFLPLCEFGDGRRKQALRGPRLVSPVFPSVFSGGRRRTLVLVLLRCRRTAFAIVRPRSTPLDRAARSARVRHSRLRRLPHAREDAWRRKRRRALLPACSLDSSGPVTASLRARH